MTGHKWFCSARMCDAFLMLAATSRGLGCFLLPRFLPDGTRNAFDFQRLKDKLRNRSNASSEVEFDGASATLVGEEGHGVRTILEMASHTRLDCVIGSAAVMRQALVQASHHVRQRAAFGKRLIEQPLMQNVIADSSWNPRRQRSWRCASAVPTTRNRRPGRSRLSPARHAYREVLGPQARHHARGGGAGVLGGQRVRRGMHPAAPLPREAHESLWEGSGNVMCLDVLRAAAREPASMDAFFAELGLAAGVDRRLDAFVASIRDELAQREAVEAGARRIVEHLALALEASLLVRQGQPAVADAFLASRIAGGGGLTFGTLPARGDFKAIVERARPAV